MLLLCECVTCMTKCRNFYQVTSVTIIHEAGIQCVPCMIRDVGPTLYSDCLFVRQMLGYKPTCFLP